MTRHPVRWMLVMAIAWVCVGGTHAQSEEATDNPDAGPLREAMLEYFVNGLRENVGLTDAQMEAVLPTVRQMEQERSAHRRDRSELMRRLRAAYRGGGSDDQLQSLLDQFEAADEAARARQRDYQVRLDEVLTVRQRIQFRFYTQRFRRRIEQRIREIAGGAAAGRPRERLRRQRPAER